jgi:glycosyltransferase involved in cell wall biosynthesis
MEDGHILLIAPSAYPLGGIATWIDYVVPGLRQRRWRVTLGLTEGILHDANTYLDAHPMQGVVRICNGTGTHEGRIRSLCAAIEAIRPDIVASVNTPDVYQAVNRLKQKGLRTRAVMTLHGIESEYYEQIRLDAESLDAIIATNRLACKLALTMGRLEGFKVFYAPYGVGLPESSVAVPTSVTPIRIGFVGRLDKSQKQVHELLAVTKEMDRQNINYRLLIAGTGPEENWLRGELRGHIQGGTVHFLGALSSKDVQELYGKIHTLLITSKWETGPIVAWEAMARRVLVVTSRYIGSGLEGNLRHGKNCLIYPIGNTAAAVECLKKGQNDDLRSRIINAAFAFVSEKMTHERSIEHWSQCFAEIRSQAVQPPSYEERRWHPAGRLDRLLGSRLGETVRHVLRRKAMPPLNPGDEWPHVTVTSKIPAETYWDLARTADEGGATVCHARD